MMDERFIEVNCIRTLQYKEHHFQYGFRNDFNGISSKLDEDAPAKTSQTNWMD